MENDSKSKVTLATFSRGKIDFITMLNVSNLSPYEIVIVPKQIATDFSYDNGILGKVYYAFCFSKKEDFSKNIEPNLKIMPKGTLDNNYKGYINSDYSQLYETIVFTKENNQSTSIYPISIEERYIKQAESFVKQIIKFAEENATSYNKTDAINLPEFMNNYHFWD